MSLEEYEEEKGNCVLKELDITEKDGSMLYIDEWNWYQDMVEVRLSNVAATEVFRKLMGNCNIMSKSKWDFLNLFFFTFSYLQQGKIEVKIFQFEINNLNSVNKIPIRSSVK